MTKKEAIEEKMEGLEAERDELRDMKSKLLSKVEDLT